MTVGEEYGYRDARGKEWRRWWLLQQAGCDDRDLSDYWFGWHRGQKGIQRWRSTHSAKAPAEDGNKQQ